MNPKHVMSRSALARAIHRAQCEFPSYTLDCALDLLAELDATEAAALPLVVRAHSGLGVAGAIREHTGVVSKLAGLAWHLEMGLQRHPPRQVEVGNLAVSAIEHAKGTVARMRADMLAACVLKPHPPAPPTPSMEALLS